MDRVFAGIPIYHLIVLPCAQTGWHDVTDWIVAIFTAALFLVGWTQLRALRSTAKGEFANKLNEEFFTARSTTLMELVSSKELKFSVDDGVGRFTHETKEIQVRDLDVAVLGPLEAVGIFEKRRALDIDFIYEMFASSIIEVFDSDAVKEYIAWIRKKPLSSERYYHLERLNDACRQYAAIRKRHLFARKCWEFKYWIGSFNW